VTCSFFSPNILNLKVMRQQQRLVTVSSFQTELRQIGKLPDTERFSGLRRSELTVPRGIMQQRVRRRQQLLVLIFLGH